MEIQRQLLIELFDRKTEKFIKDIDISHYDLKRINEICPPEDPDDIEYCDGIDVTEDQYILLKQYIAELFDVNYEDFFVNISTRYSKKNID